MKRLPERRFAPLRQKTTAAVFFARWITGLGLTFIFFYGNLCQTYLSKNKTEGEKIKYKTANIVLIIVFAAHVALRIKQGELLGVIEVLVGFVLLTPPALKLLKKIDSTVAAFVVSGLAIMVLGLQILCCGESFGIFGIPIMLVGALLSFAGMAA